MSLFLYKNSFKLKNLGTLKCSWSAFDKPSYLRKSVIANVKIANTDFDVDNASSEAIESFVSEEAEEWLKKLKNFTGTFKELPDKNKSKSLYDTAVNANNAEIVKFINGELVANGFGDKNIEAITATAKDANKVVDSGKLIVQYKKLLNVGKWKGFMEAVSIKTQMKRSLDQQVADIGLSVEEFDEIQDNLRKVTLARSGWGRYTSKKDFILGKTTSQKLVAQKDFDEWLEKNANEAVKIINLTFADIPITYDAGTLATFAANPTDSKNKLAVKNTLIKLKKELLGQWRKDKAGFKLSDALAKL